MGDRWDGPDDNGDQRATQMRDRGVEPIAPYPGANVPWRCRCLSCGAEVTPRYATVVGRGLGGCDRCAKVAAAATRQARTAAEAQQVLAQRKLEPLEPYPGATAPWTLQCQDCGHRFTRRWNQIQQGAGCPVCTAAARAAQRRQDRGDAAAGLLDAAGLEPLEAYPGANVPWRCRCLTCGAEVTPRLSGLRAGQGGCVACGITRRAGKIRIAEDVARAAFEAALVIPDTDVPYRNSTTPWPSTCVTCGARVSPTLNNLRRGHRGCRRCASIEGFAPFDVWGPGTLYLLRHRRLRALKIGITSAGSRITRLAAHQARGWEVVHQWHVRRGQKAMFLEGEVLRWWRDELGAGPAVGADEMPQGGWTETVSTRVVSAARVVAHVERERRRMPRLPALPPKPAWLERVVLPCFAVHPDLGPCDRPAYSRGLCTVHYRRWQLHGDPTGGRWPSGNDRCVVEVDGVVCDAPVRSRDMCSVHYERWYTHGDPLAMLRPTPGTRSPTCTVVVDGAPCGDKVVAREMCNRHYGHWRRHGDPLVGIFQQPGRACPIVEVDGAVCGRPVSAKGMCQRHYGRWRVSGDPLVTRRTPPDRRPKACVAVDGDVVCGAKVVAWGLCERHYRAERRAARGTCSGGDTPRAAGPSR